MQQKKSHEIEENKIDNQDIGKKKKENEIDFDNHVTSENISEKDEVLPMQMEVELERVNELLEVAHDKYIRLYAEFENYKKRVVKEKDTIIETANAGILKNILSVVDDFERGIDVLQNEKQNQYQAMQEGIKLIYDKLIHILHQAGVQSMQIDKGDSFDVERHEVISQVTVIEEAMKGKVVNVVEKGYWLHKHVLRFAKVVIGS